MKDPRPYLEETAVFVVPLHAGGGMRVKILDGWCWGLPVVTTTIGAEGIAARDGENACVVAGLPTEARTAEAFAQAVVRVLREAELAACLAAGGRRTVEAHYDWRKVYRAWDEVYQGAREQGSGGAEERRSRGAGGDGVMGGEGESETGGT